MNVVGYARVSTGEQAKNSWSLDMQRDKIAQFARLRDLDLIAVEADEGLSGKTLDRPGLTAALARLAGGEAEGLVIAKLDRLSRSVGDWDQLIKRHFGPGPRAGKLLFSFGDSTDTSTAAGRMVLNMMMTIAQWERETTVERTTDALADKRARGERSGQVPYGWDVDPDPRGPRSKKSGGLVNLVENAAEQRTIRLIRGWSEAGRSNREIARLLTHAGVPTKGRAPTWSGATIGNILRRPVPAGECVA